MSRLLSTVLLCAVLCVAASQAAQTVGVTRLVQYDVDGVEFGSRAAAVNLQAADLSVEDLTRKMAIIRVEDVGALTVEELVEERKAAGLLLVLPQDWSALSADAMQNWHRLESDLMHSEVKIPVYFTMDNVSEAAEKFRELINAGVANMQCIISAGEANVIAKAPMANIQATFNGAAKSDGDSLPTIGVFASYDSFLSAPGLPGGASANASGAVALLELARLFSRLYSVARTQGNVNLVFVLTSGGALNYAGTQHWLSNVDPRLLESIDFALSLESIGRSDEPLNLHISRSPKDADVKRVFEGFQVIGQQYDLNVDLVHKKVNISDPNIAWEHELFSRKRVLAGSLSQLATPEPLFSRSSISDGRSNVDSATLRSHIKTVAEVIARHVYSLDGQNVDVFDGANGVNAEFVDAWLDALITRPRSTPFMSAKDASALQNGLEKTLKDLNADVSVQSFTPERDYAFYDASVSELTVYKVKPAWFDLVLTLAIGAYVFCLFVGLKGFGEAMSAIKGIFKQKKSRR